MGELHSDLLPLVVIETLQDVSREMDLVGLAKSVPYYTAAAL